MNNFRKNVLIGLTVLGMGTATMGVQAQSAAPDSTQGRHGTAATQEQRQAKMAEFAAKRSARLHDELKITPAQENAFRAYIASLKPQTPHARGERANFKEMSAPARMEQMIAMQKQRTAEMEARLPALNAFYAQLTPEQKAVFDKQGMHRRSHGGQFWKGGHATQG
ncbi:Spy/CpxP family protein refolding chaperone [Massilia sp. S19_KUP03_FR1]|uniref:Spy/CpxP family protein refolding chaperone n=1 Tax=Massilia sp. S19_KUP03_FR1 TaxID=3025503 RepID=UPI002FCDA3AD